MDTWDASLSWQVYVVPLWTLGCIYHFELVFSFSFWYIATFLFSCTVMSYSLWSHGLQHTRSPCPSPSPEVCSSSCPLIGDAIQPSHPLMPSAPLPSIFPSIMNFSIESAVHIRWPKYWSFSISISPSSEYSELISLKIDWFDFFAVQGTFRSLLYYQSSDASILWCSAFFTVQLSQTYMTTGKTTTLTIQIFVGRVMSLLFCMILYHCSII